MNFEIDVILFLVWILTQGSGLPQMGQFLLADIFSFMVCFFFLYETVGARPLPLGVPVVGATWRLMSLKAEGLL